MDNYKLAIINNKDNNVNRRGSINDGDLHINCLISYIREKYCDNKLLMQLNDQHTPDTAAYYLTLFDNNILFLNTTHNVEKYGRTGIFFMPDDISDYQREMLYEFADDIHDYSVDIAYDFEVENGFLNASELRSSKAGDIKDLLDTYFEKKNINKVR